MLIYSIINSFNKYIEVMGYWSADLCLMNEHTKHRSREKYRSRWCTVHVET